MKARLLEVTDMQKGSTRRECTLLVLRKGTSKHQEHQTDCSPKGQADQGYKENTNRQQMKVPTHRVKHPPQAPHSAAEAPPQREPPGGTWRAAVPWAAELAGGRQGGQSRGTLRSLLIAAPAERGPPGAASPRPRRAAQPLTSPPPCEGLPRGRGFTGGRRSSVRRRCALRRPTRGAGRASPPPLSTQPLRSAPPPPPAHL